MNAQISSSSSQATPTFARQLVERLSSRLENEKRELVLFLVELADFDAEKLALELGYPSTLGCLVRELGEPAHADGVGGAQGGARRFERR